MKKTGKAGRAWAGALAEVLLAAVILLGFAYIHHGRDYLRGGERQVVIPSAAATAAPESMPPSESPLENTPVPEEATETDGPFTSGEVEQTENSYRSANVSVRWTRCEETTDKGPVVYYIADIYLRSPEYLRTAYVTNGYETVHNMAAEANAILAVDGDYAFARDYGPAVRNGVFIRKTSFEDVLVYYADGSMQTFSARAFDMDAEMEKGVLQVWSFGPSLLDSEGKSLDRFNTNIAGLNPRTALGYYEPGHYCIVVVDGRQEASVGYKLVQLSQLFEKLGCKLAYNFDGGRSSVMVWDGGKETINVPAGGGRAVTDIIYIAKE